MSPGRRGLHTAGQGTARAGGEGRHQGHGPDVRHPRDAACVRDSEYVMEPRALMPAAPPRPSPGVSAPSTPLGQGSHPGWTAKGARGSPVLLHCCSGARAPQHRRTPSTGGRPLLCAWTGAAVPPFSGSRRPSDGSPGQWRRGAEGAGLRGGKWAGPHRAGQEVRAVGPETSRGTSERADVSSDCPPPRLQHSTSFSGRDTPVVR